MVRKYIENIQVSLKSVKNNGYFKWRPVYIFLSFLAHVFVEWETFPTKLVEKIKTRIWFSHFFLNRAVCETVWKNVDPSRLQMTIWRIACCIPTYTNTHFEYVMFIVFFIATMVGRTRLNFTLYVRALPILFSFNEMNTSFSLPAFPLWTRLHGDLY
jgi:hypothetical protein